MSELILLVEDDPVLGPSLQQRLVLEGFSVVHATTLAAAREFLGKRVPNFVLSDIRLPDGSGADLLREVLSQHGAVPIVYMTAYGSVDQAVELVRDGARDYLAKPFNLDELVSRIQELLLRPLAPQLDDPFSTFGLSASMRGVRSMLDRLAGIDLPVLLIGETGTGKEIAARYLHAKNAAQSRPFEAVNCGQLSPELADSTLFGHEKGAFTSAHDRRIGVLESVGEGTLLLDEIGDTGPELQLKLLRVLQERQFRRLGATQDLAFKGRLVCATNRDLEEAVRDGVFREDLLFRINVVTIRIPPLRERLEEVAPLLTAFAANAAQRMGIAPKPATAAAVSAAEHHDWPGNVRELRNRVERAVALSGGAELTPFDLFPENTAHILQPAAQTSGGPKSGLPHSSIGFPSLAEVRDQAERTHILRALDETDGRLQDAAKLLDISRTTLWERMRRHGIDRSIES
ncbi:sigma-54-dependent transcriptional regulator [Roseibium sp.]|uniref:sigma-54-dependent transcriptional regulator n=1 Tax=Roseibium sp. TaxID=1936156 RepID=UPI003B50A698